MPGLTHFKADGYGWIVPNIARAYITGGEGLYDTLPVFSDLDTANYAEMYSGGPLPVGSRYFNVVSDTLGVVDTFYRTGDTDGTPTSTTQPSEIHSFIYFREVDGAFGMEYDYYDGGVLIGYAPYAPPLVGAWGLHDGGPVPILFAPLAAGTLSIGIYGTGPGDTRWHLSAFGLRYPLISTVRPPLRQWPRDDGLRRTPGRTSPTSRQGSLRRGPRGTYT